MVLSYVQLRVPRSGTYIMKPTASCEAAQLWVRATPPPKYSSPEGDLHILYDIEDDSRSRFAEPREGEGMLIPQLRSFGACSGFLMDTCPLGTRRGTKLRITHRWLIIFYGRLRGYGETP